MRGVADVHVWDSRRFGQLGGRVHEDDDWRRVPAGTCLPCHFWHSEWDVKVLVHGDDFVAVGPRKGVEEVPELDGERLRV